MVGDNNVSTVHDRSTHVHHHGTARPQWPVQMGTPHILADCYQPRPEAGQALDRALSDDVDGPRPSVRTAILVGLGGVGKSQLAASYLRRWRVRPGPEGFSLWVTAPSRSAVVDAYAQAADAVAAVAADAGAPPPRDPGGAAQWFLNWLSRTEVPWRLVLDDVADPVDLRGLWPEGPAGAAVLTTRRADAALRGAGRRLIAVGLFHPSQSRTYLEDKLRDPAILRGIDELVEELGHLPLALAQAAAFILDRPGETCADYRARLVDRRLPTADLFPADALADDYEDTLAATWALSMEQADRLPPAGAARAVLELASQLDANGVGMEVLTSDVALTAIRERLTTRGLAGVVTRQHTRDALAHLARLSLATFDPSAGPRAVRIHALVQRVTREQDPDPSRTAHHAASALLESWREDAHDPEVGRALRDNAVRVGSLASDMLWDTRKHGLLFRTADSLGENGQVGAARDMWSGLAVDARARLGDDDVDTLSARHHASYWRGQAGDAAGAADEVAGLLEDLLRILGEDHPDTLRARGNLARWRGQAGQPEMARAAFEGLLRDHMRVLGPEHAHTLATRANLAFWRGRTGDPVAAARTFAELLDDHDRILGPEHVESLLTRGNLAFWRGRAGQVGAAAAAFQELAELCHRVLGPDHPHTLGTRANAAYWIGATGEVEVAVGLLKDLVADDERVLGPEHPHTLATRASMLRFQGRAGHAETALEEFERLLTDRKRLLGERHPDTLSGRHDLAVLRGQAGDPQAAHQALGEALADRLLVLGPRHPDTLATRHTKASWQARAGDVKEACNELSALLDDMLDIFGADHPETLEVRASSVRWRSRAPEAADHRSALIEEAAEVLHDLRRVLGAEHSATRRMERLLRELEDGQPDDPHP